MPSKRVTLSEKEIETIRNFLHYGIRDQFDLIEALTPKYRKPNGETKDQIDGVKREIADAQKVYAKLK